MFKIQTNVRRRLALFQNLLSRISETGVVILIDTKRWIVTDRLKSTEDLEQTYEVAASIFDRYQTIELKPPKTLQISDWDRLAKILKFDSRYG